MLRLQTPLPDRYTLATPEELEIMIREAKATLGDKVLILGHHYQRPEVIRWADMRGDSFKLARFAADNTQATDIVFCGVHFMAESADVLTGRPPAGDPPRPERRAAPWPTWPTSTRSRNAGTRWRASPTSSASCRSRT